MELILHTSAQLERTLSHGAVLCTRESLDEHHLVHYRTKGSKNGVRQYQNEDGSLTPEGYRHYADMYGWGKNGARMARKAEKYTKKVDKINGTSSKKEKYKARLSELNKKATESIEKEKDQLAKKLAASSLASIKENIPGDDYDADLIDRNSETYANYIKRAERELPAAIKEGLDEHAKRRGVGLAVNDDYFRDLDAQLYAEDKIMSKVLKDAVDSAKTQADRNRAAEELIRVSEIYEADGEGMARLDLDSIDRMVHKRDKNLPAAQTYILSQLKDPLESTNDVIPEEAKKDGYSQEVRQRLIEEMREKSGDWYYGESKTEGHKKICDELNKIYDTYNDALEKVRSKHSGKALAEALKTNGPYQVALTKMRALEDDLMGQVLRDMGYPDTPENREQAMFFAYREH